MKFSFLIILIAIFFGGSITRSNVCFGQEYNQFWLGAGLGMGVMDSQDTYTGSTFGGVIYASYSFNQNLISIRGSSNLAGEYEPYVEELAFMYGRALSNDVSLGAGIGRIALDRTFKYRPEIEKFALGLAVELQLRLKIFSFLGLGLYSYGNLNREAITGGATLGVMLGKL